MTALRAREQTGRGQVLDMAIIEPMLTVLGPQLIAYDQLGELQPRHGNRSSNNAPRNTYQCADGRWVAVSTSAQSIAERVMRLVGRPELIDEPWFATGGQRAQHADELDDAVGAWIAERDRDEVVAAFEKAEAAVAPIYTAADVLADPQYAALGSDRHRRRRRARPGPLAERAVPALRDPGPRPDRRPAPRRAHRGGARPPRDRRRPAGGAAGGGRPMTGPGHARSWLYVPAHRPELLDKALSGPADAVVLDLEDAVPAEAKESARDAAVRAATLPRTKPLWVRVNAVGTPWSTDDLAALTGTDLDGVRVPKAGDPGRSRGSRSAWACRCTCSSRPPSASSRRTRWPRRTRRWSPSRWARPTSPRTSVSGARTRWPGRASASSSRAGPPGIAAPITSVWTDLADPDGLERDSREARDQGFFGRSVIHPKQVEPVHRAFTPSADEVTDARALLGSLTDATGRGESAWVDAQGPLRRRRRRRRRPPRAPAGRHPPEHPH